MNIYDELTGYQRRGIYPMHMPGHKRNPGFYMDNPYSVDMTEVKGMDDLHHPDGMIRELMDRMRRYYGTRETYVLVNGSTCGILAGISACCRRGDGILMDRNCHRSVYHAAYLLGLRPSYIVRETDAQTGIPLGIRAGQVEEALTEHPDVSCVVVASPTYEGVLSEMEEIAEAVHKREIPLLVDAAHGAHLAWGHRASVFFPAPATESGADLVVESLHKTLPALTQTAVLHLCSGRVGPERVERYLDIYETSSPSYVLMASVGQCMEWLENNSRGAFSAYEKRLRKFSSGAENWRSLSLWDIPGKDPSKIVIAVKPVAIAARAQKFTGCRLAQVLREQYKIELEMAAPGYALAMTGPCDTDEGFGRLAEALREIDAGLAESGGSTGDSFYMSHTPPGRIFLDPYDAVNGETEAVPLGKSIGRISAEYAYIYPPGVPFLAPGEEITKEVVDRIRYAGENDLELLGLADDTAATIRVCVTGGNGCNG